MYRLNLPAEPLRRYIENYWFVSHQAGEEVSLHVDVFVDARADLIFNFEAGYLREIIGGDTRELSDSNLDAQRLVPIRIRQRGAVRIVGVRFRLGGLGPFATVPLAPWTGQTPPPAQVLGPGTHDLEAGLRRAAGIDAATSLLDEFFLARLRIDPAQDDFDRALETVVESAGRATIDELADAASTSRRQVQRLFAQRLGLPPRTVTRVVRFQGAIRRLMVDPRVPLGQVAADAGYYDQAHFVRDFRTFTGGVPRGYRGYYPPEGPDDFAPNVVVYVQDRQPGQR